MKSTPLHPHQFDESVPYFPSVSHERLNFLLSKTSISLSPWSMNVVAGCPLDCLPCFGPESSRWEIISVDLASTTVATKLTAAGIFGELLNSESGPPRPGASLSDYNYVVIPLTYIQSNW